LGWIILGVVAALGTLPPGLHEQPVWPFSVRLDTGIFSEPDLYITTPFGIAWIAFGIAMRRFRWPAIAVGIVILGFEAWRLPFPEAYPTTFRRYREGAQGYVRRTGPFAVQRDR
jgi:hypothetical protein